MHAITKSGLIFCLTKQKVTPNALLNNIQCQKTNLQLIYPARTWSASSTGIVQVGNLQRLPERQNTTCADGDILLCTMCQLVILSSRGLGNAYHLSSGRHITTYHCYFKSHYVTSSHSYALQSTPAVTSTTLW